MTCPRSADGKHHYSNQLLRVNLRAHNTLDRVLQRGYADTVVTCKHCFVGARLRLDWRNGRVLIAERARA
jgi:hypothetical protein